MKKSPARTKPPAKAATGISGFDEITGGGLPSGRTTLIAGGPGSGKTLFALQFLVHGARHCKEPGILVAFEESSERIVANAANFGWDLPALRRGKLFILDAQPRLDTVQSGDFDLEGLLAGLQAQARAMGARRIVFDALDIVLALLPDEASRRREVYRLHDWLLEHKLTGLITMKSGSGGAGPDSLQPFGFMQFMVDCTVALTHAVVRGVSLRNLRVQKYRGSAFDENEAPFLIDAGGLEVAASRTHSSTKSKVSSERVSSGVERLDTMLGGGYYRGASILITGLPGTAKTSLGGAFAQAACKRGEKTLFVSFDSDALEVARNLSSVGIRLDRYVKGGQLRMVSARTIAGSAETCLAHIKAMAREQGARCLVIDPVSTWSRMSRDLGTLSVNERLGDWCKAEGITLLSTSLLDETTRTVEAGMSLQISTLADTWIHLNYLVQAGERNRGLSIIKSRGMAHSNQVRELLLSDAGITLADAYTAGGEVLMGTLRWQKERAERAAAESAAIAGRVKRVSIDAEQAELDVRLKALLVEIEAKRAENELLTHSVKVREGEASRGHTRMKELRGADATVPSARRKRP